MAKYIRDRFGVVYSIRGVTKLLNRIGFSYKKVKIVPGKADRTKQEEFVKTYEKLKKDKQKEDVIYFGDGCHPKHNPIPAYGWIEKGTNKNIKTNTGRQRINLNGVVNIEDVTDIEVLSEKALNNEAVIRMFEKLLIKHTVGTIYIILDNARYYYSSKVKEFTKSNPRIQLVFLPPYSPNLNIIERLWLFFQKKMLYNKYYESFTEFENKCLNFFSNISRHKKELKSLLTDNFQIIGT